jgi:hypothetical protein
LPIRETLGRDVRDFSRLGTGTIGAVGGIVAGWSACLIGLIGRIGLIGPIWCVGPFNDRRGPTYNRQDRQIPRLLVPIIPSSCVRLDYVIRYAREIAVPIIQSSRVSLDLIMYSVDKSKYAHPYRHAVSLMLARA